ncbi:hypothetical protein, partial [Thermodesulfatator atlanticus]
VLPLSSLGTSAFSFVILSEESTDRTTGEKFTSLCHPSPSFPRHPEPFLSVILSRAPSRHPEPFFFVILSRTPSFPVILSGAKDPLIDSSVAYAPSE